MAIVGLIDTATGAGVADAVAATRTATNAQEGLATAAQITKLEGIETGAQKNIYTWTNWIIPASVTINDINPPFDPILYNWFEHIKLTATAPFKMMVRKQSGTPDGTRYAHYGFGDENATTNDEIRDLFDDALTAVPANSGTTDSITATVDIVDGRLIKSQDNGNGTHSIHIAVVDATFDNRYQVGAFNVATTTDTFSDIEIRYATTQSTATSDFGDLTTLTSAPIEITITDVAYGATADTACEGNDSRLSDARTPTAHGHEGTAILSTGEVGGTKFLREDGDGTCSWQTQGAGIDQATANSTAIKYAIALG